MVGVKNILIIVNAAGSKVFKLLKIPNRFASSRQSYGKFAAKLRQSPVKFR